MKANVKTSATKLYPLRAVGFFALAFLCLLYYFVIFIYLGPHTSIIWIWLVGALFFSVVGLVFLYFGRLPLEYPPVLIALVLVVGLACSFVCFEAALTVTANTTAPDGIECIIVLGASVKDEAPSKALAYRIEAARLYLERNPDTIAVLSGGMGEDESISEAECMRRELVRAGIGEERLILEDNSRDTAENIKNTLAIISDKYKSVGIVTSSFHLYRSIRLMQSQTDIEVVGISAPFPSPMLVHFAVREYVGMCHDTIRGNIR